jgi:hypothetical protein
LAAKNEDKVQYANLPSTTGLHHLQTQVR